MRDHPSYPLPRAKAFSFIARNFSGTVAASAACHFSSVQNYRNLVPFFYIRRSCYDLDHFAADIHLADDQLIRIRVALDLFDLSNNDLLQVLIQTCKSLYLCA